MTPSCSNGLSVREKSIGVTGRDTTWRRYVDNVIVINQRGTYLENTLRQLTSVCESIRFIVEERGRETTFFQIPSYGEAIKARNFPLTENRRMKTISYTTYLPTVIELSQLW